MLFPIRFLIPIALLASPLALHAATSAKAEQDYQQVRKIALRDPKVRAAYAEADRKLEAKIAQIDPTLAARRRGIAPVVVAPKPKPIPKAAIARHAQSHVVRKGETLGSIALKMGVSVAVLKEVNHISDERKLHVGQVLTAPAPQKKAGFFDRLNGGI